MSHTTSLKGLSIRDAEAIRSAVIALKEAGVKIDLLENAKPRMYYSNQHGECAFVLKLEGPYDVGLELKANGLYEPVFDEWAGHVQNKLGASCPAPNTPEGKAQRAIGKFLQQYALHAAMNQAVAQGYMVEGTTTDEQGNIHLTLNVA